MANDDVVVKLPPETVRKIQVLRGLTGAQGKDIVDSVVKQVDLAIGQQILEALGMAGTAATVAAAAPTKRLVQTGAPAVSTGHPSEIADGLGDDDPNTEAEEKNAIQASLQEAEAAGNVTEADLERDMDVQDPGHEAKGMPGFREKPLENPESVFGLGIPNSPKDEESPAKVRRARVSYAGNASDA